MIKQCIGGAGAEILRICSPFHFLVFVPLLIGVCFSTSLFADEVQAKNRNTSMEVLPERLFDFSISTYTEYELRSASVDARQYYDNDLFQNLQFGITMPQSNLFGFHFLGSLRQDLDGGSSQTGFSPFEDIGDTRTTPVFGYVYESYLDINYPLSFLKQIRVGRQTGERDEPLSFDGLAVDIDLFDQLVLTVYGGIAFHYFEIGYNWGSDFLAGAGADYLPLPTTNVSLDYLFLKDEQSSFFGTTAYNHLLAIKLRQDFFSFIRSLFQLRLINLKFQDLSANIIATFPDINLELSTKQIILFTESSGSTNELSPYSSSIGSLTPYFSFDGKIRKLFGNQLIMDLGFFTRGLLYQQDSSIFNRKYSRIYSVTELDDLFIKGFFLSLTGDLWFSNNNEYYSAGLDLGYTLQSFLKGAKISLGTYFSLFKYEYYLEPEEKEMVRTFYSKIGFPLGKSFSFYCSYEFEASIEQYHRLKIEAHYEY